MKIDLKCGDCLDILREMEEDTIDCVITSPPYDNLRTYNGTLDWSFDKFKKIALHLWRVVKEGGVVVWVVGDATIKGSETGTSFKQALYFMELGFNLHDTMIYAKENYVPLTHNRYEQEFEYMFIFSKGKPKTFNPIKVACKYAGTETWGKPSFHKTNSSGLVSVDKKKINDTKIKGNIFYYRTGKVKNNGITFPAPFPEQLAHDHIISWTNEGDIVLDCFMGSGTVGKMCKLANRNFIGIELVPEYFEIAEKRIKEARDGNIR